MKFFRSHIIQFYGLMLLLAGILFSYAKPLGTRADHSAFTNWLESHLNTSDEAMLQHIEALSASDTDLDEVIREASQLVLNHSESFEFSEKSDKNSPEDHYRVLLNEWKNFQTAGNGMRSAVFAQQVKPHSVLPSDAQFLISALSKRTPELTNTIGMLPDIDGTSNTGSYILSPLKSGTAINAP